MRFPSVINEIIDTIQYILLEEKEITRNYINAIIDSELNYIFTNDVNAFNSNSDQKDIINN